MDMDMDRMLYLLGQMSTQLQRWQEDKELPDEYRTRLQVCEQRLAQVSVSLTSMQSEF